MKHNKIRNTSILFEALTRAILHETMQGTQNPVAFKIIRKHFKPNSLLLKELQLYQSLMGRTEHDANELFELAMKERKGLDEAKLNREKFLLIGSLKKHYDLKQFLETRIGNYKLGATIFKLFDGKSLPPNEFLDCKKLIFEQLQGSKPIVDELETEIETELRGMDKSERSLVLKCVVESFNDKFRSLSERQKTLLSHYINEDAESQEFKDFISLEVRFINERLSSIGKRLDDDILKIKINEALNLSQTILSTKRIKDEHLSAMLKYYELIEELKQ